MKINHPDGSVTDTDKLSDCSAELMEKANIFFEFCKKNKIPFFLRFIDKNNRSVGKGKIAISGATYMASVDDFVNLMSAIDGYFYDSSGVHFIDMELVMAVAEKWMQEENEDDKKDES